MNRCALLGIVVEEKTCITKLNAILSGHSEYIIGRMGVPHRVNAGKEISLISIALDAPEEVISALSGKIGMLEGISAKVIYAKK